MKFNLTEAQEVPHRRRPGSGDGHAQLRALRYRRHRLRPNELRQPGLAGDDRSQPAQDHPEQRRALLDQAAVADGAHQA